MNYSRIIFILFLLSFIRINSSHNNNKFAANVESLQQFIDNPDLQNLILGYLDGWEIYKKISNFLPEEIPTEKEKGVIDIAFCQTYSKSKDFPYDWLIAAVFDCNKIKIWGFNGLDLQCINSLIGHKNPINSLVFSKNGKNLASGGHDATIKIWDHILGKCISTITAHKGNITAIDYSPDGKYIVSGSEDQTVKIWDIETRNIFKEFDNNGWITAVKYHPDGKSVIFVDDHEDHEKKRRDYHIKIWNLRNGSFLTIPIKPSVKKINLSQDNKFLICSGYSESNGKIKIITLEGDLVNELDDNSNVNSIACTNDNKYIIAGGYDKQVKIWNFNNRQRVQTFTDYNDIVFSISLSNDNIFLITGSGDGFIHIWKNQAYELLHQ